MARFPLDPPLVRDASRHVTSNARGEAKSRDKWSQFRPRHWTSGPGSALISHPRRELIKGQDPFTRLQRVCRAEPVGACRTHRFSLAAPDSLLTGRRQSGLSAQDGVV